MTAFPDELADLPMEKSSLRNLARSRRQALRTERLSTALTVRFAQTPEFAAAERVLLYLASAGEIDVEVLATADEDRIWYAPRCLPDRSLALHRFEPGTTLLEPNAHGIREPSPVTPEAVPAVLDLVIVPGLLYTPGGDRLGQGGGYYDRLLTQTGPDCFAAALVPEALLIDRLPMEWWDVPVDIIVTEARVLRPYARRLRYIKPVG